MKKNLVLKLIVGLLLALFISISIRGKAYASPYPDPDKTPRMVTLTIYNDNGLHMGFNWNTTVYTSSDVEVVRDDDQDAFTSSSVIKSSGTFRVSKASEADGIIHSAISGELELNTKYKYRVGDSELNIYSEVGTFTTGSSEYKPFNIVHVSDPQAASENYYKVYETVLTEAVKTNPSFIINTGDMVESNWIGHIPNLDQWEWALTDRFSVIKDYPLMAVAGNHEEASYDFSSRFNVNNPESCDERSGLYYSYNYNGVHFLAINTNDTTGRESSSEATGLSEAQLEWIEADLRDNQNAKWIIVYMHKGIFDSGGHSVNQEGKDYDIAKIRNQLAPLFSTYKVSLVLQGHDHLYSKTYPVNANIVNNELEAIGNKEAIKLSYTYNETEYEVYNGYEGTIYLNSGSSTGSKYYVPIEGMYSKDIIEYTENPSMVMYSNIIFTEDALLINTYTLNTLGEKSPYKSFGILNEKRDISNPVDPDKPDNPDNPTKDNKVLIIVLCTTIPTVTMLSCGVTFIIVRKKKKENIKND